ILIGPNQSKNRQFKTGLRDNYLEKRRPPECLEFIVVHELVHLLERKHNQRFITLMDTHLPNWREHREKLNKMPLAFNRWGY
uniref:M48 metallopeptidase family protein n=1 Tax=Aeromonas sp. QDB21 TaxID=2990487 RepID=UPI0022E90D48